MTGSVRSHDHHDAPAPDASIGTRLSLRADGGPTGDIDGAWWPHSDVLSDEVPGLLAVLTDRIGPVERLSYDLADWASADRRLSAGGRRVRLDGFRRRRPAGTVHAVGTRREVVTLFVIPPATPPEQGAEMLRRAGDPATTLASLHDERSGATRPAGSGTVSA